MQTVYQEDYFSLLNATEIAPLNSYYPAKTQDNLNLFSTYSHNAVNEVCMMNNMMNLSVCGSYIISFLRNTMF